MDKDYDKRYEPSKIFKLINEAKEAELPRFNLDGFLIKPHSERYELFEKSLNCCLCNRIGNNFKIREVNVRGVITHHINLFSEDGMLMTKDHIIPKSKGGRNEQSNYQTMCYECNDLKGSQILTKV